LIDESMRDYMHFWGFSSHPTNDSPTQFAKYDNQTPDELESKYDAYKRLNAKVLNEGLPNKETWKVDADAPIVHSHYQYLSWLGAPC